MTRTNIPRFFKSALFPLIVIVFVVFGASVVYSAVASSDDQPCVGTVTEKFTEYEAGVGINSGNVTIPTGSTVYSLAIKRSDGSYCSRSLKKSAWLEIQVGGTID